MVARDLNDPALMRRDPALPAPSRLQSQRAWMGVSAVHALTGNPLAAGAYAAASWTLQLTDRRPVGGLDSGQREHEDYLDNGPNQAYTASYETGVVEQEFLAANDLRNRLQGRPGAEDTIDYITGACVWLAWWMGHGDLPHEFIPGTPRHESIVNMSSA